MLQLHNFLHSVFFKSFGTLIKRNPAGEVFFLSLSFFFLFQELHLHHHFFPASLACYSIFLTTIVAAFPYPHDILRRRPQYGHFTNLYDCYIAMVSLPSTEEDSNFTTTPTVLGKPGEYAVLYRAFGGLPGVADRYCSITIDMAGPGRSRWMTA